MGRVLVNRNKTGGTNPNIPQTAEVGTRGIVNRMKKGGSMKKAQGGLTTKKGRTTMNIDSSGYAAGKKAGFPAQMISPKTKYSKGDTTNVTVNSKMVKKSIKKAQNGATAEPEPLKYRYPGQKSKEISKTADRNYRSKSTINEAGESVGLKQRRTVKGLLLGKPKVDEAKNKNWSINKSKPEGGKMTKQGAWYKKGGTIKKKCC
jgi:hypothetical protein